MNVPNVFLALSLFGLLFSLAVVSRVRIAGGLLVPTFFVGWLRGELVLWTLAIEAIVTAVFVSYGALEAPTGQAGLVLTLASWGLLLAAHRRSLDAGRTLAPWPPRGSPSIVPSRPFTAFRIRSARPTPT